MSDTQIHEAIRAQVAPRFDIMVHKIWRNPNSYGIVQIELPDISDRVEQIRFAWHAVPDLTVESATHAVRAACFWLRLREDIEYGLNSKGGKISADVKARIESTIDSNIAASMSRAKFNHYVGRQNWPRLLEQWITWFVTARGYTVTGCNFEVKGGLLSVAYNKAAYIMPLVPLGSDAIPVYLLDVCHRLKAMLEKGENAHQ